MTLPEGRENIEWLGSSSPDSMETGMPSVAVILPYFNRVDTLGEAIESVLNQTHEDLELLLIDDGSVDGSAELARSFDDPRIRHVTSPINLGVGGVRNLGLTVAKQRLVSFMDSDDEWFPHKLSTQVKFLQRLRKAGHDNVAVIGCGWEFCEQNDPGRTFQAGPFNRREVLMNRVAGLRTPALLIDRGRWTHPVEFDARLPVFEDRDFVISCLAAADSDVAIVPEVLFAVRRGRGDHASNPARAVRGWELLLEKYAAELAEIPDGLPWYHFRVARECVLAGDLGKAWDHLRPSLGARRMARVLHLCFGAVARGKGLAVAAKLCSADWQR